MAKGKIIVIEGTDCSGKETQTALLFNRLRQEGRKIEKFTFPAYDSPTGKIVAGPYLSRDFEGEGYFPEGATNVDPKVASLYYAADRRYNMPKIQEVLDSGADVILDRYVESNMGHQGCKIFDKEERLKMYKDLENLEYGFLELPRPDITFFLYMPYDNIMELKKGRGNTSDQHENSPLYLKNAERTYLELCDLHNYRKIECTTKKKELRPIEDIHEEIYQIVKKELFKKD